MYFMTQAPTPSLTAASLQNSELKSKECKKRLIVFLDDANAAFQNFWVGSQLKIIHNQTH